MGERLTWLKNWVASPIDRPVFLGLATGLYPILFYYLQNYYLINTARHLLFFVGLFLALPAVVFMGARFIFRSYPEKFKYQLFTFLSVGSFGLFIQLCLYTKLQWFLSLVLLVLALLLAVFLYRLLLRIFILQLLLAVVTLFFAIPTVVSQLQYSETWMQQPDGIEAAVFQKTPNIYLIQPDGYVNFSELDKGFYQFDNGVFEEFLAENAFQFYPNARSNYGTTLTSNTALFSMRHHYYNNGYNFKERLDARHLILSDNAVLRILKNNHYQTNYLAEWPYLLTNSLNLGYDYCNFSEEEIPLLTKGFDLYKDVVPTLTKRIRSDEAQPQFFFIELFEPGHIATNQIESAGVVQEREWWLSKLQKANEKLTTVVELIQEKDPTALVVIMADHGGYVGLEYMRALRVKTENRAKIYSGFSTLLAIKWPNNDPPAYDSKFKTSVNLFRILFAYLSENESYLEHLQDDGSYHLVNENAVKGIYKYINDEGEIVFERQN